MRMEPEEEKEQDVEGHQLSRRRSRPNSAHLTSLAGHSASREPQGSLGVSTVKGKIPSATTV